ncbi:hypothetical protein EJM73_05800 [Clostridium botulinum]|uniref:hypothetical protein n=1 Tax=Clostridium TaxID=1485 RepID=UPI000774C337|nr:MULTISPECIES: hypothetical protein [Clostridium]AUM93851.1 hypothetical protein RSJ11_01205 [Clostridium sporogenes]MCC5440324.1 hypothetical protein [Clostridium botulinum]NCI20762.1 hypothetical protein [Clostridium botulinum]NCI35176.1 hypothetical protein [Clostridium botulinum]NCI74255.1 hypothetical protein [Clostridium botulinum]
MKYIKYLYKDIIYKTFLFILLTSMFVLMFSICGLATIDTNIDEAYNKTLALENEIVDYKIKNKSKKETREKLDSLLTKCNNNKDKLKQQKNKLIIKKMFLVVDNDSIKNIKEEFINIKIQG